MWDVWSVLACGECVWDVWSVLCVHVVWSVLCVHVKSVCGMCIYAYMHQPFNLSLSI